LRENYDIIDYASVPSSRICLWVAKEFEKESRQECVSQFERIVAGVKLPISLLQLLRDPLLVAQAGQSNLKRKNVVLVQASLVDSLFAAHAKVEPDARRF
jgi:hypothetical protein